MHTRAGLKQLQSLPLEDKIGMSMRRVGAWLEHWDDECYVAFSGGKDSTVLLDLVRSVNPEIPGVFSDTGLEFPEIKRFAKSFDNVTVVRPRMTYRQVVDKYGYALVSKRTAGALGKVRRNGPASKSGRYYLTGRTSVCTVCSAELISTGDTTKVGPFAVPVRTCPNGHDNEGKLSKLAIIPRRWHRLFEAPFKVSDRCCDVLKKQPMARYERKTGRKAITGEMAADGLQRTTQWIRDGCNIYGSKHPKSMPLAFWTEKDIWDYIRTRNIRYCSVYDQGYDRTGCVWCCFGVHMEKGDNRFQLLKKTHPKLWNYCINDMGLGDVLDFIEVPYE